MSITSPQTSRTFVAALIATLVARAVAAIPLIADILDWVDGVLVESGAVGVTALGVLQALAVAVSILLYQKGAQWIGNRWPGAEKFLLGSNLRPIYIAPATTGRHAA